MVEHRRKGVEQVLLLRGIHAGVFFQEFLLRLLKRIHYKHIPNERQPTILAHSCIVAPFLAQIALWLPLTIMLSAARCHEFASEGALKAYESDECNAVFWEWRRVLPFIGYTRQPWGFYREVAGWRTLGALYGLNDSDWKCAGREAWQGCVYYGIVVCWF